MLTRRAVTTVLASCTLAVAAASTAQADDGPDISKGNCDSMFFCVGVSTGGNKGGGWPAGDKTASSNKGKASTSKCTVRRMEPQPPPGSLFYQGKGKIAYERTCDSGPGPASTVFVGAPPGANVPQVDPQVLARQAVDKMLLKGPDIDINPRPGGKGLVGMPVWMAADQSQTTWGPNTASATAGGVTVTATATVSKVVWGMGDGTSVTCTGPGTVYKKSFGLKKSPDCGHVYAQPSSEQQGGKYMVTATSTWTVDWQVTGGGESGQLTEVRQSDVELTVVVSQAVNS